MAGRYQIERTAPTVYLDGRGQTVTGFIVYFQLPDYGEFHEVRLPNLNTKTVQDALEKFVSERDALSDLGNPQPKK